MSCLEDTNKTVGKRKSRCISSVLVTCYCTLSHIYSAYYTKMSGDFFVAALNDLFSIAVAVLTVPGFTPQTLNPKTKPVLFSSLLSLFTPLS